MSFTSSVECATPSNTRRGIEKMAPKQVASGQTRGLDQRVSRVEAFQEAHEARMDRFEADWRQSNTDLKTLFRESFERMGGEVRDMRIASGATTETLTTEIRTLRDARPAQQGGLTAFKAIAAIGGSAGLLGMLRYILEFGH
jgi:hypothetical protein